MSTVGSSSGEVGTLASTPPPKDSKGRVVRVVRGTSSPQQAHASRHLMASQRLMEQEGPILSRSLIGDPEAFAQVHPLSPS